jgi:hypothetical protein
MNTNENVRKKSVQPEEKKNKGKFEDIIKLDDLYRDGKHPVYIYSSLKIEEI